MGAEESNKALARRWFDQGWSQGNVEIAPEIFAVDFVLRGTRVGPAGPQRSVRAIRSVFEPLSVDIDFQVAEGEFVVTRYTAKGRHAAQYRGIEETGRWISVSGVQTWRVVDGMAVEDWNTFDEWDLVTQLGGALPRLG